jgi:hypothetical protein
LLWPSAGLGCAFDTPGAPLDIRADNPGGLRTHVACARARLSRDSPETRIGRAIIDLVAENLDNSFLPLSLFFEAATRHRRQHRSLSVCVSLRALYSSPRGSERLLR